MLYSQYKQLVVADLFRITGKKTVLSFLHQLFFGEGYKYVFWMRTCAFSRKRLFTKWLIYPLARFFLVRYRYRLGISIPPETEIGSGLYIGHFGGIVVNEKCKIGRNCNISHGVTIGQANRGRNEGCATLGDNVYIGPGAKIVGAVTIGNCVAIGANCVVTKDVPDNAVIVGIPGKVISFMSSKGYISRTDY